MESFLNTFNEENKKEKIKKENKQEKINYKKLPDDDKLKFIEEELLHTIEKIDDSLKSLDMYERDTNKIYGIYDLKNKFLESRRQTLKGLFDIISHKQKMEKEDKGENFTDIVKM